MVAAPIVNAFPNPKVSLLTTAILNRLGQSHLNQPACHAIRNRTPFHLSVTDALRVTYRRVRAFSVAIPCL